MPSVCHLNAETDTVLSNGENPGGYGGLGPELHSWGHCVFLESAEPAQPGQALSLQGKMWPWDVSSNESLPGQRHLVAAAGILGELGFPLEFVNISQVVKKDNDAQS